MRRSLLAAVIGTTLAGCTGDVAGLVNAAQQAAQQQIGKPSANASPAPSASPTTVASASPTAAAVTASVSLEGQPGTIKPVAATVFTSAGAMHSAQYTIGERAQDGSLMLVVSITANKPFTAADLSKADLAAFSVQVFRFGGAGVLSTHRNLSPLQIPKEDITITPGGGKLDIKASLTNFVGLGTLTAAQIDLKGLPTN
jgi:hypothetical protein